MKSPQLIQRTPPTPTPPELERLLNETQLAELTGIAAGTYRNWRNEKSGPPYCKLGKSVRYKLSLVNEWIAANTVSA